MRTFPFASFDDLTEALSLIECANGVRPYVLEWFYNVFVDRYNERYEPESRIITRDGQEREVAENRIGLTTEELVSKTKEVLGKTYTKKKILDNFINPLMNQGYIDSMESELDRRCIIYYPTGVMTKNKKLFDSESSNNYIDGKSKVSVDPALFPHKDYIISQIRVVLKYSETDDGSMTIQDHDRKEITVEELVNRHYDNPTDYFDSGDKKPINVCERNKDNCGSSLDISDNPQMHLSTDFKGIETSREDQIDQIDKLFAEYHENDDITKELEDISYDNRDPI